MAANGNKWQIKENKESGWYVVNNTSRDLPISVGYGLDKINALMLESFLNQTELGLKAIENTFNIKLEIKESR